MSGHPLQTALTWVFGDLLGARVIGDLHGMNFTFSAGSSRYFRFTTSKYSRIRVLGNGIRKRVEDCGFKNELCVIDNGIEDPGLVTSPGNYSPDGVIRLLYFGAISESKGFGRTLEIFQELHMKYPTRVTLDIAGEFVDPVSEQKFRNACENQTMASQMNYHGRVLLQKKWDLLMSSTLLIHLTQYDGQPLTIIEAMACGVPTVATRVGAIPEMIAHNENGFLVDRYRDDSVRSIVSLMEGAIPYESISQNAKNTFFKRFTAQTYAKNIERLVSIP